MTTIPLQNIQVNVDAKSWKQAIEIAGNVLVNNGQITKKYIEEIIQSVEEHGPYFVLLPRFALAHAKPSDSVLSNSISLITLKEPVSFGSVNDPVSVILCLACTDKDSHVVSLEKIAGKLVTDNFVEMANSCETAEDLFNLINK